jgi:hypothetical protein
MLTLFFRGGATGTSCHRRRKSLLGAAAMTAGAWAGLANADVTTPFSIAVLPDTQYYAAEINGGTAQMFYTQTQWVADNRVSRNIAFLAGVGDIVDTESALTQWAIATAAYGTIDNIQAGAFPYSAPMGNHDVLPGNNNAKLYFGDSRYAGRSWYGGSSPDGLNFYQRFTGGGQQFLSIGINYQADAAARNWVKGILAANPNTPTIISTHDYLNADANGTRSAYGQILWDDVIKTNNQIFMVLAGHNPGVSQHLATNNFGHTVHEIMVDYQAQAQGGAGFMRLMEFLPATNLVHSTSFAPISGGTKTDATNEFDIMIPFAVRFNPSAFTLTQKTFQQGVSGYTGTSDTHVRETANSNFNTTSAATASPLFVDNDDIGGSDAQALIKFGNIFTDEGGTVPRGATITQAILTLTTGSAANDESPNRLEIREITRTWADSDTWTSLVNGIDAGEYATKVLATGAGTTLGLKVEFDVTESLQAWSNGGINNGWVFLPTDTNAWKFNSSEFATLSGRPQLSVTYATAIAVPEPGTLSLLGAGLGALLWRKKRRSN